MSAKILDGKTISKKLISEIKIEVNNLKQKNNHAPGLAVILVGDDPASRIYVNNKQKACQHAGILSELYDLPSETSESKLISLINNLNNNQQINGILVQLPLPKHINQNRIIEKINPKKDIDGFHPYNLGRLAQKRPLLRPCTPAGIMALLEHTKEPIKGKQATIIGVSNIVGRPMILELLMAGATITACHKFTNNLPDKIKTADILISATGNPNLIKGDWIKPGTIVIDVGINRLDNGKLIGDVDFNSAKNKASWITPVPGGVGPMTIATLLQNTLNASKNTSENTSGNFHKNT